MASSPASPWQRVSLKVSPTSASYRPTQKPKSLQRSAVRSPVSQSHPVSSLVSDHQSASAGFRGTKCDEPSTQRLSQISTSEDAYKSEEVLPSNALADVSVTNAGKTFSNGSKERLTSTESEGELESSNHSPIVPHTDFSTLAPDYDAESTAHDHAMESDYSIISPNNRGILDPAVTLTNHVVALQISLETQEQDSQGTWKQPYGPTHADKWRDNGGDNGVSWSITGSQFSLHPTSQTVTIVTIETERSSLTIKIGSSGQHMATTSETHVLQPSTTTSDPNPPSSSTTSPLWGSNDYTALDGSGLSRSISKQSLGAVLGTVSGAGIIAVCIVIIHRLCYPSIRNKRSENSDRQSPQMSDRQSTLSGPMFEISRFSEDS
ncbi:hypothetical protein N7456_006855 [Penicillium angulare]|uniref:Uncharacterized protein n=1 Tax=Penicillium angulare TaxID=116970 RepID=A0A9W9FIN5_9EURO|nr:hypothetical protein N7456_006855 [Penicillium angulare]